KNSRAGIICCASRPWPHQRRQGGARGRQTVAGRGSCVTLRRRSDDRWPPPVRDPAVWRDREKLEQLARGAEVEAWTPELLTWLPRWLRACGGDDLALLRRAQQRYPRDLWLSFKLGVLLRNRSEALQEVASPLSG